MSDGSPEIVDWVHFERSRTELGPGFIRILSYFREDGTKSVADIEQAMREQDTVALIIPAHTLKGEARQFGEDLGLDSIDALELSMEISRRYGFQLRSDDENNQRIFGSLASLSAHIEKNRAK